MKSALQESFIGNSVSPAVLDVLFYFVSDVMVFRLRVRFDFFAFSIACLSFAMCICVCVCVFVFPCAFVVRHVFIGSLAVARLLFHWSWVYA